jgi:menaquinone-9 beta-reductase
LLTGRNAHVFQRDLARRTVRPIIVARAILAVAERPATAPMLVKLMRTAPGLATLLARATRCH